MDLCILPVEDLYDLTSERQRVAAQFRQKIAALGILRVRLAEASTEHAREHLRVAMVDVAGSAHELGDKLLDLEAAVLALEARAGPLPIQELGLA